MFVKDQLHPEDCDEADNSRIEFRLPSMKEELLPKLKPVLEQPEPGVKVQKWRY